MPSYPFDRHFIDAVNKLSAEKWKFGWDYLLGKDEPLPGLLSDLEVYGFAQDKVREIVKGLKNDSLDNLIQLALSDSHNNSENSPALTVLQHRATKEVFERSKILCFSSEAHERALGLQILMRDTGQIFHSESIEIVLAMLETEIETIVLESLAYALCHLRVQNRSLLLIRLITHLDPTIREAVAFSLAGQNDATAVKGLIALSKDSIAKVRSWAIYGLGAMTTKNTRSIRDALLARVTDGDEEIRLEAINGLAARHDKRVLMALKDALKSDDVKSLSVDAAKEIADPALLPLLLSLKAKAHNQKLLDDAIRACSFRNS